MATLLEEAPVKHAPPPPHEAAIEQHPGISEDWLAVCIGLFVFVLSLGLLFGKDVLGWAVTTSVWTIPGQGPRARFQDLRHTAAAAFRCSQLMSSCW